MQDNMAAFTFPAQDQPIHRRNTSTSARRRRQPGVGGRYLRHYPVTAHFDDPDEWRLAEESAP